MDNPQFSKKGPLTAQEEWENLCDALAEDALEEESPALSPNIKRLREQFDSNLRAWEMSRSKESQDSASVEPGRIAEDVSSPETAAGDEQGQGPSEGEPRKDGSYNPPADKYH
ncbi:MAG TPA: hypothetical protein VFB14_24100 [Bryobacteraceae bacterium]|nr:hypothetical protein [Bryobacteraceae bacterium]